MRRYLVLALTIALVMVFVAPAASAQGPHDAIFENLEANGAFSVCDEPGMITNGHVFFGGRNAILTPGQGGDHANGNAAVSPKASPSAAGCDLGGSPSLVKAPGLIG